MCRARTLAADAGCATGNLQQPWGSASQRAAAARAALPDAAAAARELPPRRTPALSFVSQGFRGPGSLRRSIGQRLDRASMFRGRSRPRRSSLRGRVAKKGPGLLVFQQTDASAEWSAVLIGTARNLGRACRMCGAETQGQKKEERPVGVPAARGHGVMEVQQFEAVIERPGCREGFPSWSSAGRPNNPESLAILPVISTCVDRPLVHFV
jgi:hypothetical protein